MEEQIIVVRELKWKGPVLMQKVLIQRGEEEITEWRPVEEQRHERLHRHSVDFWESLDWDRTNIEIATELQYSPVYIAQKRSAHGHKTYKHARMNWDNVDWSMSNSQIARQLGRTISLVSAARSARGITPHPRGGPRGNRVIDLAKLDLVQWEWETDASIANRLGVTRERIRQLRVERQKPECKVKWSRFAEAIKWCEDNREKLNGMNGGEIVRMMPTDAQLPTKFRILHRSGIQFVKERKPLKYSNEGEIPLNWKMPNKWLALVWGMTALHVSQVRMLNNKGPATWRGGGFSRYINNPDFAVMLNAEIKKAQEKGVEVNIKAIEDEKAFQKASIESTWAKKRMTEDAKIP